MRDFNKGVLNILSESYDIELRDIDDFRRYESEGLFPKRAVKIARFMQRMGWGGKISFLDIYNKMKGYGYNEKSNDDDFNKILNLIKEDIALEEEIKEKYLGDRASELVERTFEYPAGYDCSEVADDVFEEFIDQNPVQYRFTAADGANAPFNTIAYGKIVKDNIYHVVTVVNKKAYDRFMSPEPIRWKKYLKILEYINPRVELKIEEGNPKV